MDSQHATGAGNQALQLAMTMGLDGPPILSNISSVMTDADGGLNLIDIPLSIATFNGLQSNLSFSSSDDLFGSNVVINGLPESGLNKMSDGNFITSMDALSKAGDNKSPLNIMVVSDGIQVHGQTSPALPSQSTLSSQPLQSVVSGGDKMLSAVNSLNFNDPEILGDAAFDSTPSGTLPQFDDGLLSALGSAGQGLRLGDGTSGTSFDLFDGGVGDGLSLSPQPFADAGLIQDTAASVLDPGLTNPHSTDMVIETSVKHLPHGKKSPASTTVSPDLAAQSKFNSNSNSQCPVCGKTFNNITALAKHRLTHSDERKYVCNVCSKGFKRQDHLNGHRMTHLDKKPFECQVPNCDKGYCDQRSLRRHLEQYHHLDPETIQSYVQSSMAAVGISPPTPRSANKNKSGDKGGGGESRSKNINSPVYSPGSSTTTPSPGSAGTGNTAFQFDPKKQQQHQNELLVQQIHQQQKAILQQQKLQKQHEEQSKLKESMGATTNDAVNKQVQLQLQVQQKQHKPQNQKQQQQQQQQQQQPADMVAVIQQVQKLQQKFKQQQPSDTNKPKGRLDKEVSGQQGSPQWQDKAGVYTFVGTPTSNEQSPVSRSDMSPIMPSEMPIKSPVSPVTMQPISPMANPGKRAVWVNSSQDSQPAAKEEPPKPQAYCSACDRYFKNAAALNGHMRCHGGFSNKGKSTEKKSNSKKNANNSSSSSSEMGPPLRRPPHASTPSPQSMMRTSPTIPTCGSPLTPTSAQSPGGEQTSAIVVDKLNGGGNIVVSEQLMHNQKHKHLQEQLSSHLLKRRMSGDQLQQPLQQQAPQQRQLKTLPTAPIEMQSNSQDQRILDRHITSQFEDHLKEQQQQIQQQQQPGVQFVTNQLQQQQQIPLQIGLNSAIERPVSPQQGEHIQRIIQSFQQVEELHRQQQQQQQLHLSPEQLDQIRQEHKLIGLPPLNPEQLQFQLQDQQNQMIQAQIREQQLQEQQQQQQQNQQHQQQFQVVDPTSLVMTPSTLPLAQSGLIQLNNGSTQAATHNLTTATVVNPPPHTLVKFNYQPTAPDNNNQQQQQVVMPSQAELSSSVQHILATLDPVVVNAAGLNQQQILAQLQKQQQQQQQQGLTQQHHEFSVAAGMQQNVTAVTTPDLVQQESSFPNLQVNHIPQILLQPPSTEDINGIPTISIPESVVLGVGAPPPGQIQVPPPPTLMETEQQQIERIQNGLMASAEQQQQESAQFAALSGAGGISTLSFGVEGTTPGDPRHVPNFLNVNNQAGGFNSLQEAPAVVSQPTFTQLRESNIPDGSSICGSNNSVISTSSLLQSLSSPATSSAVAKNTDAAVAQILRNINNSLVESGGMGLNLGHVELQQQQQQQQLMRSGSAGSSNDGLVEDKMSSYPLSSVSPKHFLGSIKQDVMLSSSAVDKRNNNNNGHGGFNSNDSASLLKEVPYSLTNPSNKLPPSSSTPHHLGIINNNKRRLSADLESQRKTLAKGNIHNNYNSFPLNPLTTMVNPLEVEGISSSSGRVRARSKSGDVSMKYMRSKSVDHSSSHFTPDSLFRANKRTLSHGSGKDHDPSHDHDIFSRSDGADVFRNPGTLPSPLKIKRKHRPAPLYIPSQFGIFQSRLRSPRVITSKDGHLTTDFTGRGHTPPPYTPPPMLSPFRSGSGLFCSLNSAFPRTPGSAPVSGKFSQSRRGSLVGKTESFIEVIAEQIEEAPAPETDTQAHINIGIDYQAVLPEYRDKSLALFSPGINDRAGLMWGPSSEGDSTDSQLQSYQELSCSAAVKGNGCNVEYALHLLHLAKGNLSDALLMLMGEPPSLTVGHPMLSYKYQETDMWTSNEMERYLKAILDHDKDFFKIANEVESKSVKQCVQFYYMWKKVCPDDYKRLRQSRNKQNDYNTRRQAERAAQAAQQAEKAAQLAVQGDGSTNSLTPPTMPEVEPEESVDSDNTSFLSDNDDARSVALSGQGTAPSTANSTPTRIESPVPVQPTPPVFSCTHEGCNVTCTSKQSLKRHMRKHQDKPVTSSPVRKPRPSTPNRSPVYDQFGEEIFPCRLCGRVFAKVKSRSAHMKSHKIAEQAQQEKKAAELAASEASSVFVTH